MTSGGYWNDLGLQFQDRWALSQLVLMTDPRSEIESLEREPVGKDETGVDLWVNRSRGRRECHQCKRAKEGRSSWSMKDLHREGIFGHLKLQLERDPQRHFYRLISGTPAGDFESLLREANHSRDADSFWIDQVKGKKRLDSAFVYLCACLELEVDRELDRQQVWNFLRGTAFILHRADENTDDSLADRLQSKIEGSAKSALALLESWLRRQLRCRIDLDSVAAFLQIHAISLIRGDTDRFMLAGAALAKKRALQGGQHKFKAELVELNRLAADLGHGSNQILGGRWNLIRQIGGGGIAEVWLGEDRLPREPRAERNTNLVAVKLLRAERALDQTIVTRFVQGGLWAHSVGHPAITRVLEKPRQADGRHFYIMEHLIGETFDTWSRQKSGNDIWAVVSTVGSGLRALHQAGLVHGDIKPRNILVDRAGNAKLCDFDLVQLESTSDFHADPMGTIPFLAPEVRRGRANTTVGDQYSLAMTLVQILSADSHTENLAESEPEQIVRSLNCSLGLKACLKRALSPNPSARYESIEEFLKGLGPEAFEALNDGVSGHTCHASK